MRSPSTDGGIPSADGPLELLERAAVIGGATCALWTLIAGWFLGPIAAWSGAASTAAFAWIYLRLLRRDVRGASAGLLATSCLGMAFAHFTFGGLEGWSFVLAVNLPMVGLLLERSRTTGLQVLAFVVVMVGASLVLPDRWIIERPHPDIVRRMRRGLVLVSIVSAGTLAAHAVRRLEEAMTLAQETEARARQAAERKTMFLANISHELRTPMNAILGYSELVLEDSLATQADRADVERIRKAGRALLTLINEVLRVARLDAGGPETRETCEVPRLVARWIAASDGRLEARPSGATGSVTVQAHPERIDRLVADIVEGYRRCRIERVGLTVDPQDDLVSVAFHPDDLGPHEPVRVPLVWLLAERSARGVGVRFHRYDDGRIELWIPIRSESSPDSAAPLDRWPLGITFPLLPSAPIDDLRTRLAIRMVVLSIAIVVVVGPLSVATQGDPADGLPVLGLLGLLFAVLGLYRMGRFALAETVMAVGMIVAVTAIQATYGGSGDIGMLYLPSAAVLGTLIMGSRGGYGPTMVAGAGIGLLGVGDELGWLAQAAPTTRFEVAFVTLVATAESAAIVGLWARPLQSLVSTASEAAARASEADRATTRFLDVVSLELRTPLNAILGYAEMLLEEDGLDPHVRGDLRRIVDAGQHLLGVVDDLLDMSAIVADQLELEAVEVDVGELLGSVTQVLDPVVRRHGNTLCIRADPAVGSVIADGKRVRQILVNLLSNAAKFTREGTIEVRLGRCDPGFVQITVADDGIGMAPDDLAQLFKPFRQVHRGTPGQYGGTGLGLAISRQLARKMGGDIVVCSTLGVGSEFRVRLPSADAERAAVAKAAVAK